MFITKTRTAIVALVASASFAAASVAPAVSQAQWHTICYSGHCTTHANYTIAGQDPCAALVSQYNNDLGLDSGAQKQAALASDEREAFLWGCTLP